MLRNPNFSVYGTSYANNIYDIEVRTINPVDNDKVEVDILLSTYTDATKAHKVHEKKFSLLDLTNDPATLCPALYQIKLIEQHGTEEVDGTILNNFIVL